LYANLRSGRFFGDDVEGIAAHFFCQPFEVGAENRQQYDFECELAHVIGDIDQLTARRLSFPFRNEALIGRIDEFREFGDDAAMERRLHHVALALPQIAFARHDAEAEQDLHAIEPRPLGVVAVVRDQHPLDIVGMIDDPHGRTSCGE
jgi:hypothetical protein